MSRKITQLPRDVAERPGAGVSANDAIIDLFMERAVDLLRLEAGVRDQVIALLDDLENEIAALIVKVDPNNGRQQARLQSLLKQVRETIRATYRTTDILLAQEVRDIVDIEATWTGRAINAAVQVDFVNVGITRNLLETLVSDVLIQGAPTKDWWSRQAAGLDQRFSDEMRRGIALGETNDQLIKRVRGTKTTKGFMDLARTSAERLVRASVQTAANVARETMYDRNADIIKALQWHATLDTRTSIWCITRDGHLYGPKDHEPLTKGTPPWLEGPGKLHWGALVEGTQITTRRGSIPIERVEVGDSVLTHDGNWSRVTARRAKRLENHIVRVVHTQSGRVLRATDDHPVRLSNGAWVFVGALEVGDELLCNSESVTEIAPVNGVVHAEPQDGPTVRDDSQVSVHRALQLVAPDVNFEGDPERGYREIEYRSTRMILRNPSLIKSDQSAEHHLFALADALQKVGRNGLRNLLTLLVGYKSTRHAVAHTLIEPGAFLGLDRLGDYVRSLGRVVASHTARMLRVLGVSGLGGSPRPMIFADGCNDSSRSMVEPSLVSFTSHDNSVSARVGRQTSVRQVAGAFNAAQRGAALDVLALDQVGVVGAGFLHEQIIALDMQTVNGNVYDLEVDIQSSYVANGLVVSNCRSTSVPVMKSWKDLGIDAEEVPDTTRASMDGQVAADLTFEEWLKKQSEGRQNTVLGVGKADLWRRGKITFRDLLDQSGRPMRASAA